MAPGKTKKKPNLSIDEKSRRFSNFRQEHQSFVTLAFGHAGKAKILNYDLDQLISSGALHTAAKTAGTIFTMDHSLTKSQLIYFFLFGVSWAIAHVGLSHFGAFDIREAEELSIYLNLFIPFILGLFITSCLARWWILRIHGLGDVLDASQNIALIMSGMFPGPEWSELHDQVLRWGLSSVTLIVNACRGVDDMDSLGPERDNLLTLEELALLNTIPCQSRPVLIWTWVLMLNAKICDERNIPVGRYRDVAQECVMARNGISLIWTYIRTQLPFAYVHLVAVLVNLNNLIISIKCGTVMALAVRSSNWSECTNQVLFLCVVPALYQGLLGISHIIHDPFGEDLLDFPVMAFQEYMNEVAFVITGFGHQCPALSKNWCPNPAQAALDTAKIGLPLVMESHGFENKEQEPPRNSSTQARSQAAVQQLRDTVLRMESTMQLQVSEKKQLIGQLQSQLQGLESSASIMSNKILMMENMLLTSGGGAAEGML